MVPIALQHFFIGISPVSVWPCIRMALCYGEEAGVGKGDPSPGGLRMTLGGGMALSAGDVVGRWPGGSFA